jgi:uncharacterized membrane protein YhaH (DUF805 family)
VGWVVPASPRMQSMSGYLPATISYCTNCGAEVESGSRFCGSCGQALAPHRPPVYSPVAQPVSATIAYPQPKGGFGKLFSSSGRIGRLEYFLTILGMVVLVTLTFAIPDFSVGGLTVGVAELGILLSLPAWIISIFAGIKRLHDFDQSGWLILLGFVPIVGLLLLLVMLSKGPSPGLNRFGYAGSGTPF